MENTDINISALENVDIDKLLRNAIKERIEKLILKVYSNLSMALLKLYILHTSFQYLYLIICNFIKITLFYIVFP